MRKEKRRARSYAPPQGGLAQSTVYAKAADDVQHAAGSNAANYDIAVHQHEVGPASTLEYSHLALRNNNNDAGRPPPPPQQQQ